MKVFAYYLFEYSSLLLSINSLYHMESGNVKNIEWIVVDAAPAYSYPELRANYPGLELKPSSRQQLLFSSDVIK